jgi:hypothetical protein
MTTYKLLKCIDGEVSAVLRNNKDSIPFDPANTDYQQYLKFLEEGGVPLPADTPEAQA